MRLGTHSAETRPGVHQRMLREIGLKVRDGLISRIATVNYLYVKCFANNSDVQTGGTCCATRISPTHKADKTKTD